MEPSVSQTIRIVVVAESAFADEVSSLAARSAGGFSVEGIAASLTEASRLVLKLRPDVVLIDEEVGGVNALELVQGLIARVPAVATLVALSAGDIAKAEQLILSGASAFIVKPFAAVELFDTLERVKRLKTGKMPGEVEGEEPQGRIIVVCGPKGGVGRTTLAVNLAVALAQMINEDVVLVDASSSVGDIDLMLNLHPAHTLADMPSDPEEIDDRVLEAVLAEHASGVRVLAGWRELERLEAYRPAWLAKILSCLRDMVRYVVVDLDSTIDETALAMVELCDWAILVVTPEITALRPTRLFMELISDVGLGSVDDKLLLVLNRASSQGGVPTRDIERQLRLPIVGTIPSQGRVVTASANRGVPVVSGERRSRAARGIIRLAQIILDREIRNGVPAPRPSGLALRIRGRLRGAAVSGPGQSTGGSMA